MATHSSILAWRIPMEKGAWQITVHGVAKNWAQLSDKQLLKELSLILDKIFRLYILLVIYSMQVIYSIFWSYILLTKYAIDESERGE